MNTPRALKIRILAACLGVASIAALPACRLENGSFQQDGLFDCTGPTVPRAGTSSIALRATGTPFEVLGQSFTAAANGKLSTVTLNLGRARAAGAANAEAPFLATVTLEVDLDYNGAPADRILGTATVSGRRFASSAINATQPFTFTFNPPIELRQNQVYWLRLNSDYAMRADLQLLWATDVTGAYTRGQAAYRTGLRWDDAAIGTSTDFVFQLSCQQWDPFATTTTTTIPRTSTGR